MDANSKLELDNTRRYHFVLLGFAEFKDIIKKFVSILKFYRFENQGKINSKEIIYDMPDDLLSDSGIVISKLFENGKVLLQVNKLSSLRGDLKRPSKKYNLGTIGKDEEPKDYSLQITQAIESSFTTQFTVDLDAFVQKTIPKIEIDIEATKYKIICGSGYRAAMYFEEVVYKDIKTKKKVSRPGVTLQLPADNSPENDEILKVIDRQINELALYNLSRFEIAKQLLYPKPIEEGEGKTITYDEDEE